MFFPKLVIRDKEPCPCGSDKKYKDCCKGKSPKIETKSKKPPDVQVMEKMRAAMKKYCLHPDKDRCKGKIKAAHALQNNKIISLLAGTKRHIYMLDTKKKPLLIPMPDGEVIPIVEMSKTSANDATTETCFCDYHDNVVFAVIEKGAPDYDMDGKKIKHTVKGVMHRIAITIFPESNQSWLLVSCLEDEKRIYEGLFNQLKTASLVKLKFYVNLVLPLYSENMVLSMDIWDNWNEEVQRAYTYYANLTGKDAYVMGKGIGFRLKNAASDKTG